MDRFVTVYPIECCNDCPSYDGDDGINHCGRFDLNLEFEGDMILIPRECELPVMNSDVFMP